MYDYLDRKSTSEGVEIHQGLYHAECEEAYLRHPEKFELDAVKHFHTKWYKELMVMHQANAEDDEEYLRTTEMECHMWPGTGFVKEQKMTTYEVGGEPQYIQAKRIDQGKNYNNIF